MKLKRHIDMPNNRRMRLRYFPKTFHHAIMVTKFPQNLWFFFLCELSEYWFKWSTNLRILVCVTMLRLRGWGVTTIIFSLRRNIFSLRPFFTYISTPCQCKGSVIVFFFPSSSKWGKMFYSFERTQHVFFLSNYFLTSKQKKLIYSLAKKTEREAICF